MATVKRGTRRRGLSTFEASEAELAAARTQAQDPSEFLKEEDEPTTERPDSIPSANAPDRSGERGTSVVPTTAVPTTAVPEPLSIPLSGSAGVQGEQQMISVPLSSVVGGPSNPNEDTVQLGNRVPRYLVEALRVQAQHTPGLSGGRASRDTALLIRALRAYLAPNVVQATRVNACRKFGLPDDWEDTGQ